MLGETRPVVLRDVKRLSLCLVKQILKKAQRTRRTVYAISAVAERGVLSPGPEWNQSGDRGLWVMMPSVDGDVARTVTHKARFVHLIVRLFT